jgi:hypothetical protein
MLCGDILYVAALNRAENSQLDLLGTWKQRPAFSVLLIKPEKPVKAEGRKVSSHQNTVDE